MPILRGSVPYSAPLWSIPSIFCSFWKCLFFLSGKFLTGILHATFHKVEYMAFVELKSRIRCSTLKALLRTFLIPGLNQWWIRSHFLANVMDCAHWSPLSECRTCEAHLQQHRCSHNKYMILDLDGPLQTAQQKTSVLAIPSVNQKDS